MPRRARLDQLGASEHEHVPQLRPHFVVGVNEQRDPGIQCDVADPAETASGEALRLRVDDAHDIRAIERKAYRNRVWLPARIGRGQPGNARSAEQHPRARRHPCAMRGRRGDDGPPPGSPFWLVAGLTGVPRPGLAPGLLLGRAPSLRIAVHSGRSNRRWSSWKPSASVNDCAERGRRSDGLCKRSPRIRGYRSATSKPWRATGLATFPGRCTLKASFGITPPTSDFPRTSSFGSS